MNLFYSFYDLGGAASGLLFLLLLIVSPVLFGIVSIPFIITYIACVMLLVNITSLFTKFNKWVSDSKYRNDSLLGALIELLLIGLGIWWSSAWKKAFQLSFSFPEYNSLWGIILYFIIIPFIIACTIRIVFWFNPKSEKDNKEMN